MYKKAVLVNIAEPALDKEFWDQLDTLVETKVLLSRDDPNLQAELSDCDCLLLGFQVDTQKDIIDAAPNLKYIGVLATAYGTIDLPYAVSKNILVTNLAGYSTEAVAEFTLAILLYQMRNIEEGIKRGKAGSFDESGIRARELKNSQFGVVGLGSIGNRVAELAAGFGANVSYWSREKKDSSLAYKTLDEILSTSDYISINVAETAETQNLLNMENISTIKAGAVIVSTVPPSIIDNVALAKRLEAGDITFISDHGDSMSDSDLELLKKYENVILVPGIGYITDEARQLKQEIFISNIKAALAGAPTNVVS
ncbi:hypothetical protein EPN95_03070 [Patescibacteria group bacterium]|nr:MAG: hypothetical protein EPN95_03070 [Patescibacteria group bacterium]